MFKILKGSTHQIEIELNELAKTHVVEVQHFTGTTPNNQLAEYTAVVELVKLEKQEPSKSYSK